MTIKSIYDNQDDILDSIEALYLPDGFECDITYGNGVFYKNRKIPQFRFDLDGSLPTVTQANSTNLPVADNTFQNIMFDPPFLTYVKQGREHNSIMAKRFSGYWRYDELEAHYKETAKEAFRTLKKKGIFIVKCQDIIHNHSHHPTHIFMHNWCLDVGFKMLDMFILQAKHRMPVNKAGKQQHARIFHSYFLLFKKP